MDFSYFKYKDKYKDKDNYLLLFFLLLTELWNAKYDKNVFLMFSLLLAFYIE